MDIADEFGVACSSLSTSIKNKSSILGAFPDVDKAVFAWFCEQRTNKVPLSGRTPQQKALDFACSLVHNNFKASPS
ncbi:hypothetical protein HPB50_001654 [Hyalomma asiaticum]|uniref:Uncharacterized protein n=1 Tax=Hyalomma asiaticum TaxID=266040 RepID=A0ACB7RRS8_HYAAI|nr:hypothetical protein HPB50_001654 [Hyalomma asiaticum]